jgi:hypothetical protein
MAKTKNDYTKQATRHDIVFGQAANSKRPKVFIKVTKNGATVTRKESVDEFMARNGIFDKLLSQIDKGPHRTDWETQLDELRNRST